MRSLGAGGAAEDPGGKVACGGATVNDTPLQPWMLVLCRAQRDNLQFPSTGSGISLARSQATAMIASVSR